MDHVEALRGVVDDHISGVNRLIAEYLQELAIVRRFIIASVAAEPGRITIREDGHWVMAEKVWVRLLGDGSVQTDDETFRFNTFYRDRDFVPYIGNATVEELMAKLQNTYLTKLATQDGISELKELGEHILRG